MFNRKKKSCNFSEIPVNQEFYTKRHPDVSDADSIRLVKQTKTTASSFEWSEHEIHPEQPCWYYTYD
ncbi:hypothetical protein QX249_10250 [Vibrio parahaemolyticus]|uniref:Uncharacterized protein n=1 Tax=Vibrio parahaemolyticus TaxID=670 RepID=A0AAW8Q188_VIBPH|nr:hypothetical protein [Vibrio parahaemolyticus]MDS1821040.1 hypothetical protein [Vibrio parahaemolyticus]